MLRRIALLLVIGLALWGGFTAGQYYAQPQPEKPKKDLGLVLNPPPSPYWAAEQPKEQPKQDQAKPSVLPEHDTPKGDRGQTATAPSSGQGTVQGKHDRAAQATAAASPTPPPPPPPQGYTLIVNGIKAGVAEERNGQVYVTPQQILWPKAVKIYGYPDGAVAVAHTFGVAFQPTQAILLYPDRAVVDGRAEPWRVPPIWEGQWRMRAPVEDLARLFMGVGLVSQVQVDNVNRTVSVDQVPLSRYECRHAYSILEIDTWLDGKASSMYMRHGRRDLGELYLDVAGTWGKVWGMFMVACREWWNFLQVVPELVRSDFHRVADQVLGVRRADPWDHTWPVLPNPEFFTNPKDPDRWVGKPFTPQGCRYARDRLSYGKSAHEYALQNRTSTNEWWDRVWALHYDFLLFLLGRVCD